MVMVGNHKSFPEMYGFVWSNNIFSGSYGMTTTGGGAENCAYHMSAPAAMLASCFKDSEFSHNALVGPVSKWPTGNFVAASPTEVRFNNSKDVLARYKLLPTSPYAHAGTDGKALGADMEALAAAVVGVR